MQSDANPKRVVGWEVLPGLPGDGPVPLHFHMGHPTPWTEGLVIRFWNEDGTDWVGNFQGRSGNAEALLWPEADAVAVIAGGDFYLLSTQDHRSYSTLGPNWIATEMTLDEYHGALVVAAGYGLHAFDPKRNCRSLNVPDGFIRRIVKCTAATVTVEIEDEHGGPLARPSAIVEIPIKDESEQPA